MEWPWGWCLSMLLGATRERGQMALRVPRALCSSPKTFKAPPSLKCPSWVRLFAPRIPRCGTTPPPLAVWWGFRRLGPLLFKSASPVLCVGGRAFLPVALGPLTLGVLVWLWPTGVKARAASRCSPACLLFLGETGLTCTIA